MVLYLVGVQLLMPKGITPDSQVESRQPFAQQSHAKVVGLLDLSWSRFHIGKAYQLWLIGIDIAHILPRTSKRKRFEDARIFRLLIPANIMELAKKVLKRR